MDAWHGEEMKCPQCGEEAWDEQTRCTRCGSPLPSPGSPERVEGDVSAAQAYERAQPKKRNAKCINCGEYNYEDSVYCGRCGLLTKVSKECPGCHGTIAFSDRYCTTCGKMIRPGKITRTSVRPIAALIIAMVPGLFSIWGMGHFFAGSPTRGLGFFLLGILMLFAAPLTIFLFAQSIGDLLVLAVIGWIVWFALWLYQSMDAYWEAGGE
jgi:ribosomal protein S27AE